MGWLLIENGQLNRGLELLKNASNKAPQAASIQFHYAVGLARSGDHPQAKKVLQRTLASNPSFPESMEARKLLATLTN
jgi:predicted Zn-dependent protease